MCLLMLFEFILAIEASATSFNITPQAWLHVNSGVALHICPPRERFAAAESAEERIWTFHRPICKTREGFGTSSGKCGLKKVVVEVNVPGIRVPARAIVFVVVRGVWRNAFICIEIGRLPLLKVCDGSARTKHQRKWRDARHLLLHWYHTRIFNWVAWTLMCRKGTESISRRNIVRAKDLASYSGVERPFPRRKTGEIPCLLCIVQHTVVRDLRAYRSGRAMLVVLVGMNWGHHILEVKFAPVSFAGNPAYLSVSL